MFNSTADCLSISTLFEAFCACLSAIYLLLFGARAHTHTHTHTHTRTHTHTNQTPVSSASEVGNLRSLVSELLFKLSQLQHFTDTLQREKNALQQSALENERLHKTAMDGFVEDIQQLRRDNFSLAEQRVKCEGRGGRRGRRGEGKGGRAGVDSLAWEKCMEMLCGWVESCLLVVYFLFPEITLCFL